MRQASVKAFVLICAVEPGGNSIRISEVLNPVLKRSALTAAAFSATMKETTESTAAMPAIFMRGLGKRKHMTTEQFEREMRYRVSMAAANSMLRRGLISQAEHDVFNAIMIKKHQPPIGGILLKTSVDSQPDQS